MFIMLFQYFQCSRTLHITFTYVHVHENRMLVHLIQGKSFFFIMFYERDSQKGCGSCKFPFKYLTTLHIVLLIFMNKEFELRY